MARSPLIGCQRFFFEGKDSVSSIPDFWHRRILAVAHVADVVELVDTQDLKS